LARQELEITLETVTPLFLGGANPRGKPELRAASFRGAMRFWLRALLGGVLGDSVETVGQEEAKRFGSTEGASPVVVRAKTIGDQPLVEGSYRPLLHNPQKNFRFPGFRDRQMFNLVLSVRPGAVPLPEITIASALLFCNLGGLGKRSRRGFGSLQIIKVRTSEGMPNVSGFAQLIGHKPESASALSGHLSRLLEWSQKVASANVEGPPPAIRDRLPEFSILSPDYAKILVCKQSFESWEKAMTEFWRKIRSTPYRDRSEFGFARKKDRRASPLMLKIWRIDDGYHMILTAFRTRLFPGISAHWDLVTRFLDECQGDWSGEYIIGGNVQW
jgi:CRISPR-associated protein Cmr1